MRQFIDLLEQDLSGNTVKLYRGDANPVEQFLISKSDPSALLGSGIYLTDNPDVAADYTTKGSSHVIWTDEDARTSQDFLRAYIRHLMDTELGFPEAIERLRARWVAKLHDAQHGLSFNTPEYQQVHKECQTNYEADYKKLVRQYVNKAKVLFNKRRDTMRMTCDTMGQFYFTKKERVGHVSEFDVPAEYLAKVLHADRPLPDDALNAIREIYLEVAWGDENRRFDLRDLDNNFLSFDEYVKNFKAEGSWYAWAKQDDGRGIHVGGKGENPSLDVFWNGVYGQIISRHDKQGATREKLQALGYVGLEYDGGTRVGAGPRGGGGLRHHAYVLWDENAVNSFRKGAKHVTDTDIPADFTKKIRKVGR